jgi:hypothetical protein
VEVAARRVFWSALDINFVPDFDAHQVFAYFQQSGISFSGVSDEVRGVETHNVRIDCQHLYSEDASLIEEVKN